jgi:acetyl-CoA acetyltransferase
MCAVAALLLARHAQIVSSWRGRGQQQEKPMGAVFAVDACRTPVGKIKGALAGVRPDHLAAEVISALVARSPWLDPESIDDVYWGAANQAGEDNRNVARMDVLLAGLPVTIPVSRRRWLGATAAPNRRI